MTDDRLDRIEGKVDKLADAVIHMAWMEKRLVSVFKRMDNTEPSHKKLDDRLDDIERQAIARGQKIAFAERIFGMICTAAIGLAFVYLR